MVLQLRGDAGARQVPGRPTVGFTHVYGAPGVSACAVLSRWENHLVILRRASRSAREACTCACGVNHCSFGVKEHLLAAARYARTARR